MKAYKKTKGYFYKKYITLGKKVSNTDLMYEICIGLNGKSLFCLVDCPDDWYENEYHIIEIKNLKKKIKNYMMSNIKEVRIGKIIECNHCYVGTIGQFILKNKSLYLKYNKPIYPKHEHNEIPSLHLNQKINNKLCYYHIITINNLLKKIKKYITKDD